MASVTLTLRPDEIPISRDRPEGPNVAAGVVKNVVYFGKGLLCRITLPMGKLVIAHAVNARRTGEAGRVDDWENAVWLSFDPAAAILLKE